MIRQTIFSKRASSQRNFFTLLHLFIFLAACNPNSASNPSDLNQTVTDPNVYAPGVATPYYYDPNVSNGLFIQAFDATPREVRIGEPTEITWFAPFADSVEILGMNGVEGALPSTGSRIFWPDMTRTYQMIARRQVNGKMLQASRFLTIFAERVIGPPRIWYFRPETNGIAPNEITHLRWRVGGCTWVRIWSQDGFWAERDCIVEEDLLPINTPVTRTYTLELLNSRRELITLVQTTLNIATPNQPVPAIAP